jgi:uncharacterized protein with NRDE domain
VCSIIFAFGVATDAPLVMAANRDELRTRDSDPPDVLLSNPLLFGGRDRQAGGTWLAVDPKGRVCAVTNRYVPGQPAERDNSRRSRGDIAINILRGEDDDSAVRLLSSLDPHAYNPVNVLYVSRTRAFWVSLDESGAHGAELPPGVHVVTVAGADQLSDPKGAWLLERARALQVGNVDSQTLVAGFTQLLHSHEPVGGTPYGAACIDGGKYGTVSGSTVVITKKSVTYAHAEGLPCVTRYEPVSLLSRQARGTGLAK